jgi:hypothetical protein
VLPASPSVPRTLLGAVAKRPRLTALLGAFCIAFSGIFYLYAAVTPETATAAPVAAETSTIAMIFRR